SAADLSDDAGPFKVAVEMSFAVLVPLFEQPAIAALRVGQDLPAIIIAIPKEEAVGTVLEMWLGDFFEVPLVSLSTDNGRRLAALLLRAAIEPVVVEEVHPADVLAIDNRNGVGATQSNKKRNRARLDDFKAEKLLVETARKSEVTALQRSVR